MPTMLTSVTDTTQTEPILNKSLDRFLLHPVQDNVSYDKYKEHVACFWTTGEVDLSADYNDFKGLTQGEKDFILHVLAFFAASDGIVNENLCERFMCEIMVPEIRQFYTFQVGMEGIHADMYGLLITTYEPNKEKARNLANFIRTDPSIKRKADWALKWISDENASFAQRLLAFACVEGIFFCSSFCAIFYFRKRGKLPGLGFSNELISRDESLHRDFAVHVYHQLKYTRMTEKQVHDLVEDAVDAENFYVEESLKTDLIGMKSDLMKDYVKVVADDLLVKLGYKKLYNVVNPFPWMELISLEGKTNFFEKRVGEYAKANGTTNSEKHFQFKLDDDF